MSQAALKKTLGAFGVPAPATGNITANLQTVSMVTPGYGSLVVMVSGTYTSGTLIPEASYDGGTTYVIMHMLQLGAAVNTAPVATTGSLSNTTRSWIVDIRGATNFRMRATAFTSGTEVVNFYPSLMSANTLVNVEGNVVISGTPNVNAAQSGAWNITSITNTVTVSGSVAVSAVSDLDITTGAAKIAESVQGAVGASDKGVKLVIRRVETPAALSNSGCYSTPTVDQKGRLYTNPLTAGTGTITSVAGSASSVTILASNNARTGATIYNDSSAILYIALSSVTASTSVMTLPIAANTAYEVKQNYTGIIVGIWASATGNARVTEFT